VDAEYRLEPRSRQYRRLEKKSREKQVDQPETGIADAPLQCRELAPPPRPPEFPGRDEEQAAKEDDERQARLLQRKISIQTLRRCARSSASL